jgi:hypothetical protein
MYNDQFFTSHVVLQKALTMTKSFSVERKKQQLRLIATTERARLHQQQPTLLIDVDQPYRQSGRHEVPAIRLTMMP